MSEEDAKRAQNRAIETGEAAVDLDEERDDAADLVGDLGEEPEVRRLAADAREDVIAGADQQAEAARGEHGAVSPAGWARSPGRADANWHEGRRFTALHGTLRHGQPVFPGEELRFGPMEGQHVRDLLEAGSIVEGAPDDDEVLGRLAAVDRQRARLLYPHRY